MSVLTLAQKRRLLRNQAQTWREYATEQEKRIGDTIHIGYYGSQAEWDALLQKQVVEYRYLAQVLDAAYLILDNEGRP